MNENIRGSFLIEFIIGLFIISLVLGLVNLRTDIVYKYRLNQEVFELKKDLDRLRIDSLKRATKSNFTIINDSTYKIGLKNKLSYNEYDYITKRVDTFKMDSNTNSYGFNKSGAPTRSDTIYINHRYGVWEIRISPVTGKTNLVK